MWNCKFHKICKKKSKENSIFLSVQKLKNKQKYFERNVFLKKELNKDWWFEITFPREINCWNIVLRKQSISVSKSPNGWCFQVKRNCEIVILEIQKEKQKTKP